MFACKTFFIILGIAMITHEISAGKDFFQCDLDKVCKAVLKVVSPGFNKYTSHATGVSDKGKEVLGCEYKETADSDPIWYDFGVGGDGENDVAEMNCCQVPTTGVCTETGIKKDVLKDAC